MNEKLKNDGRLIIVSNRLPIIFSKKENELTISPGSGGLVTALAPVLKNRGGTWIGWVGPTEQQDEAQITTALKEQSKDCGFFLYPIFLSKEEVKLYYNGYANEIIWPLFHDLPSKCIFNPNYWLAVQNVSRKFADSIHQIAQQNDFVWIHDYHLIHVGQELRKRNIKNKLGFFLHIPFPALDIFIKLPWRFQILRALLQYDTVGFQTLRDQRNFMQCVKRLLPEVKIIRKPPGHICQINDREVRVGAFPISIDYQKFCNEAKNKDVTDHGLLNLEQLKNQKIVFSCDRLDMSKGIIQRLEAIKLFLKTHPELYEKVIFIQIVIPSRIESTNYQELKTQIDQLVGEINSEFTKVGWVPIHYFFHGISHKELLAFYRISDIALITPLKDGMNLVAKEYIASNVDENGTLILSEFAGASSQLQHGAFLINPYDIEGLAETIYKTLKLSLIECKRRMRKLRKKVEKYDVFWWVTNYLNVAISKELKDFPIVDEYIPTEDTIQ